MAKLTYETHNGEMQTVAYAKTKRGSFSHVYLTGEFAYIVCGQDCADKEILINAGNARHIPQCEHVGYIGDSYVYKMPQYRPLTKRDAKAWKDYQFLRKLFNAAVSLLISNPFDGYKRGEHMEDAIDRMNCDSSICNAFVYLNGWAKNYGSQYCVEIFQRNMAVDSEGNLILLDCFFDLEKLRNRVNKMRNM